MSGERWTTPVHRRICLRSGNYFFLKESNRNARDKRYKIKNLNWLILLFVFYILTDFLWTYCINYWERSCWNLLQLFWVCPSSINNLFRFVFSKLCFRVLTHLELLCLLDKLTVCHYRISIFSPGNNFSAVFFAWY